MEHKDSRTATETLQQEHLHNNIHMITKIITLMQTLDYQGHLKHVNWVPSHVGIPGNDIVGEAVKIITKGEECIHLHTPH